MKAPWTKRAVGIMPTMATATTRSTFQWVDAIIRCPEPRFSSVQQRQVKNILKNKNMQGVLFLFCSAVQIRLPCFLLNTNSVKTYLILLMLVNSLSQCA